MPIRWQIDRGFTIAANSTQYRWWNWFGEGPNKGPSSFARRRKAKGKAETTRWRTLVDTVPIVGTSGVRVNLSRLSRASSSCGESGGGSTCQSAPQGV